MSNFNIGDRVKDKAQGRIGTVRDNTRQQDFFPGVWIDVAWDGQPYRGAGYGMDAFQLELIEVTPKVGDTIRATRGETVLTGTVNYTNPYFGTDLKLDENALATLRKVDEWSIEIIKPKVVLPTKVGAVIRVGTYTYARQGFSSYAAWKALHGDGHAASDAGILAWIANGAKYVELFPGE